jgi:hypothetical protein
MAHYAFLDEDNIVTEVIVGIDETELIEGKTPEIWYGEFRNQKCVRTSYNAKIRFNYAGVGYFYDEASDAFIEPMPQCGHTELLLNDTNYRWECANVEHDLP